MNLVLILFLPCSSSQNAHKNISCETVRDVSAILLFSSVLGAAFMYTPSVSEFFWAFSRVIDVVVEAPQLKMIWVSGGLDKWMTAYYCCIGSHVFVYAMHLIYRSVRNQNDASGSRETHSRWFCRFFFVFLGFDATRSTMSSRLARRSPKGSRSLFSSRFVSSINAGEGCCSVVKRNHFLVQMRGTSLPLTAVFLTSS